LLVMVARQNYPVLSKVEIEIFRQSKDTIRINHAG
jgi:hypothetical protein